MTRSNATDVAALDRSLAERLPAVRARLLETEHLPPALRSVLTRLPEGSPLTTVAAVVVAVFLAGTWWTLSWVGTNPAQAALVYGGVLFLAYCYIMVADGGDSDSEPMFHRRSLGGKVTLLLALVPGALVCIVSILGVFIVFAYTVGLSLYDPVYGVPTVLVGTLLPFYGGGLLRDRSAGDGPVLAAAQRLEPYSDVVFVRDVARVGWGAVEMALGFVMLGLVALFGLALVGLLLESPAILAGLCGLVLAFAGFDIHEWLLGVLGSLLGLVGGGVFGLVVIPSLATQPVGLRGRLGLVILFVPMGAAVGRWLLPLFHRLSIQISGFVVASVSTYALLTGFTGDPGGLAVLLTSVAAGVFGAVLAWLAFVLYVAIVTAFIGGLIVGGVTGSIPVGAVVFLAGSAFQYHSVQVAEETTGTTDQRTAADG